MLLFPLCYSKGIIINQYIFFLIIFVVVLYTILSMIKFFRRKNLYNIYIKKSLEKIAEFDVDSIFCYFKRRFRNTPSIIINNENVSNIQMYFPFFDNTFLKKLINYIIYIRTLIICLRNDYDDDKYNTKINEILKCIAIENDEKNSLLKAIFCYVKISKFCTEKISGNINCKYDFEKIIEQSYLSKQDLDNLINIFKLDCYKNDIEVYRVLAKKYWNVTENFTIVNDVIYKMRNQDVTLLNMFF